MWQQRSRLRQLPPMVARQRRACAPRTTHASSATRHRGWAAKKSSSLPRVSRRLNTARPAASALCAWKTCLAISRPIVVTSDTDASLKWCSTPPLWYIDAVGGRPPHHIRSFRALCPLPGSRRSLIRSDISAKRPISVVGAASRRARNQSLVHLAKPGRRTAGFGTKSSFS